MTRHVRNRVLPFALLSILLVLPGCFGPSAGPTAVLTSAAVTGPAPLDVDFDLSLSSHPHNSPMTFELDFGDDSDPVKGTEFDVILPHTYANAGTYEATLVVIDENGRSDTHTLGIIVDEAGPQIGLEIGNTAPDFEGHTTDSELVKLSDYVGQVVVLDFWGTWCPPCRNSMPHLDDLVSEYGDQGLVAVIVSTDDVKQDAIDFLAANGFTQFVSVWEPGGIYGNPIDLLYNVTSYPTAFVLDRQGVIRIINIGYPGTSPITGAVIESLL